MKAMQKPELSIITVNWNGGHFLANFLQSVERQTFQRSLLEVVMIDNGSSDGSVELVKKRFPFVKIIELGKNLGFSEAANIAYKFCHSNFVMVAGNDTILPDDFLENFLSDAKKIGAAITVANDYPPGLDLDIFRPLDTVNLICGNSVGSVADYDTPVIPRCAVFIGDRKQIGEYLFDPDYFAYGDDTWMCFRLILAGKRVCYSKTCKVWHRGAGTGSRVPTLAFFTERNRLLNIFTFFEISTIIKIFPVMFFDFFAKFFYFIFSANFNRLVNFLKAYGWFILHFREVFDKRSERQEKRKFKDDVLISRMSYKLYGHQRNWNSFLFKFVDIVLFNYCKLMKLKVYEIKKYTK